MIKKITIYYVLVLTLSLFSVNILAQPVMLSMKYIDGYSIYKDFKKTNLYYYSPGKLKLVIEPNGKPDFQLLAMQYTGHSCYGDRGETHFTNLIQFSIEMDNPSFSVLKSIKDKLRTQSKSPILRPIPIRHIDVVLVTTIKDGSRQKISGDGVLLAPGKKGKSSKRSYWTKRTFTLKLENNEAQLLINQITNGKLALSLAYSFFADVVPGNDVSVQTTGSEGMMMNFEESVENLNSINSNDTSMVTQILKSDVFEIIIDSDRYPEVLKKIDVIKGEMPPAYSPLELHCYDFSSNLRPDLAMKFVEIQALSVTGNPVVINTQFVISQPDIKIRHIRFPFAIRLDKPMKYRVTEYKHNGESVESSWQSKEPCKTLIDISTPFDENKIKETNFEFEWGKEECLENNIESVQIKIDYFIGETAYSKVLELSIDMLLPIADYSFMYSFDKELKYSLVWNYNDGSKLKIASIDLDDEYYFLNPPKR